MKTILYFAGQLIFLIIGAYLFVSISNSCWNPKRWTDCAIELFALYIMVGITVAVIININELD